MMQELYGITVTEDDFLPFMGMGEAIFLGEAAWGGRPPH